MQRRELKGTARFLTFSCFRRLPLFSNDKIKQLFLDRLKALRPVLHFQLYAWVIMPEHVHLLLMPQLPRFPVSTIMHRLKRPWPKW